MNPTKNRQQSIDILRAVTMFLMIFVNDVSGVSDIPNWIGHTEANEDGLGFADTIFPAFLFIVGLSLPFAINSRLSKGHSFFSITTYILLRSAALIIMGFFHVNSESYSSAAILPHSVWMLLVTLGFFLIWLNYPASFSKVVKYSLSAIGIVLLLLMAYFYQGGSEDNLQGMRPSWWGILGIIGWAYLVCAFIFLLVRSHVLALSIVLLAFFVINFASHKNMMPFSIWLINDASSVFLIMAGVLCSLLYTKFGPTVNFSALSFFIGSALMLILAGFIVRPFTGGISKIYSTPAWVNVTAGLTLLSFTLIIFLVDYKGKQHWFKGIRPAGTSTLTCYLLPYILYSVFELFDYWYPNPFNSGIWGIFRSLLVALFVILLVRVMEKLNLRLKI